MPLITRIYTNSFVIISVISGKNKLLHKSCVSVKSLSMKLVLIEYLQIIRSEFHKFASPFQ